MKENNDEVDAPLWMVVELMGHSRTGGLVSKDTQLGTPLLRIEVPMDDGSFVTQLVNPQSIYRLTACEEKIARHAAHNGSHQPIHQWELERHLLESTPPDDDEDRSFFHEYENASDEDEEGESHNEF